MFYRDEQKKKKRKKNSFARNALPIVAIIIIDNITYMSQ